MEVILREHVDKLGRRGDLVKVADGYARNFLLPRKMALLATAGNKHVIQREKVKFDATEAENEGRAGHGRSAGHGRDRDRAQGRRDRHAVWVSDQRRHRRGAGSQGLRPRSPETQLHEPIKKLGSSTCR